jgi:hypothetical protein
MRATKVRMPVGIGAILVAAAIGTLMAPSPAGASPTLRAASTVGNAEIEKTIPIKRRAAAAPRSVISLGPSRLPTLAKGDRLRALGEVQVTTTCFDANEHCIGRRYGFSPHVKGWITLAHARHGTGGRRISEFQRLTCSQDRPNRNHHCVLVFRRAGLDVPNRLPCHSDRCHLNVVVAAFHEHAGRGNRLVIGADRPDGLIEQGKGSLDAIIVRSGSDPTVRTRQTRHRRRRHVPMTRSSGWVSVYSLKLRRLRAGDVITAQGRQILDIDGLDHAVFDSSELILSDGPRKVNSGRIARRSAAPGPALAEANGFNCTLGPSAYRSPCVSRKAGQVKIRRDPVNGDGNRVPLYVNLIARGFLKLAQPSKGPVARVKPGGYVRVKRYRAL